MLIAVMSDSHDHVENVRNIARVAAHSGCCALIHLGDITGPAAVGGLNDFPGSIQGIFGNCDHRREDLRMAFQAVGGRIDPGPLELTLGDRLLLIMHEPVAIASLAAKGNCDVIMHGHTHSPLISREKGALILNPGECGGWSASPTFAILDTADLSVHHVPI